MKIDRQLRNCLYEVSKNTRREGILLFRNICRQISVNKQFYRYTILNSVRSINNSIKEIYKDSSLYVHVYSLRIALYVHYCTILISHHCVASKQPIYSSHQFLFLQSE